MEKNTKQRKKKKLGSYPYWSVVFSITLALFVIGLFGVLLLYSKALTQKIQENIEIQVYLDKAITESQKIKIQKALAGKPYTAQKDGRPLIVFTSREEAAAQFIEETGEDFKDLLGDNPLRDAFRVNIPIAYQNKAGLAEIKADLEGINGVFEVSYVESFVDSINHNITKISLFLLGFAAILLLAVVILINNTIKLALFSQRFLIRSMQLVGAKPGFIQRPFLVRAILYGLTSGLFACGLLYGLINYANSQIEGLQKIQNTNFFVVLFAAIVVMGGSIGLASTYGAIKKYLKMSLDDLY